MRCFLIYSGESKTLSMKCNKFESVLFVSSYIPKLFSPEQLSVLIWLFVVTKWKRRPTSCRNTSNLHGKVLVCVALCDIGLQYITTMQQNPTIIHRAVFIKLGFVYIYLYLKDSFTS